MGFLSGLFGRKEKAQEPDQLSQIAERTVIQMFGDIDPEWARIQKMINDAKVPPYMEQPALDMTMYPFENKPYVTFRCYSYDPETDSVNESCRLYYADQKATDKVIRDAMELQGMILDLNLNPNIEPFNFSLIKSYSAPVEEPSNNSVRLSISPLTPTGRNPKYPIQINFECTKLCKEGDYGGHGELSYLPNGKVGKACFDYWDRHIHHRAYFKMFGDRLGIRRVYTSSAVDDFAEHDLYP